MGNALVLPLITSTVMLRSKEEGKNVDDVKMQQEVHM